MLINLLSTYWGELLAGGAMALHLAPMKKREAHLSNEKIVNEELRAIIDERKSELIERRDELAEMRTYAAKVIAENKSLMTRCDTLSTENERLKATECTVRGCQQREPAGWY